MQSSQAPIMATTATPSTKRKADAEILSENKRTDTEPKRPMAKQECS